MKKILYCVKYGDGLVYDLIFFVNANQQGNEKVALLLYWLPFYYLFTLKGNISARVILNIKSYFSRCIRRLNRPPCCCFGGLSFRPSVYLPLLFKLSIKAVFKYTTPLQLSKLISETTLPSNLGSRIEVFRVSHTVGPEESA